MEARELYQH